MLALPRRRFDEATSRLGRALTVATDRKRARFQAVRLTPVMLSRRIVEAGRQSERDLARAQTALRGILRDRKGRLARDAARLTPSMLLRRIAEARRQSDSHFARAQAAAGGMLRERKARLARGAARLTADTIARRQAGFAQQLAALSRRSDNAADRGLERLRARLTQADRLLSTLNLSDGAILERGYALVIDSDGRLVRRAGEVVPGMAMSIRFADGLAKARADGGKPVTRQAKPKEPSGQGSLF